MPANYPPFLCAAIAGELYDVCDITLGIFCDVTGTQPTTWRKIKELYRQRSLELLMTAIRAGRSKPALILSVDLPVFWSIHRTIPPL
jgi:hypothetical protein